MSESIKDIFKRPDKNLKPLDGLRALAIIFVVCFHINELFTSNREYSPSFLTQLPPFKGGWVGVPLFFILSGYLIGGQLWKELFTTNSISFWRFIFRRGLRIWPLYYFVLIVVYIFSITYTYEFNGLIINALFLGNYLNDAGPISGSWSLATEEQFYIIAPLFLIFINKLVPVRSLSFYRKILFMLFFVPIISRYITWNIFLGMNKYDLNTYLKYIYRPFHTNCEGLITGMIISNYYYDKESFFHRELKNSFLFISLCVLLFAASFYSKIYFNFIGVTLGFSVLLVYALKSNSKFIDLLSNKYFFIVSKTSFAIYLVHYHVIYNLLPIKLVKFISCGFSHLEILVALILVMGISVVISILLYVLVEKPFLLIRERVTIIKSND